MTYERSDLNQITLAYCCSIHKSQGSEFPIVIMPVVRSHRKMLRRNLLYTGITRAKNFLILCGEPEEFKAGIERTDELARQTTLKERLNSDIDVPETVEDEEQIREDSPTESVTHPKDSEPVVYELTTQTFLTIDPMIGMKGVNPYNFLEVAD